MSDDLRASRGRILYVGGFELPDRNAAAQRVLGNAKLLRALGYEVILVGTSRDSAGPVTACAPVEGFDVWQSSYPRTRWEWAKYATSIADVLNVIAHYERIIAVVCYNYPSVALGRMIRHYRRSGTSIICDCTEWYEPPEGLSVFGIAKRVDSLMRMRWMQKQADGVICISSLLEEYYSGHCATVVIPPLVDLDDSKWRRSKQPRSTGKTTFVYAGSPGVSKDRISAVLEALAGLPGSGAFEFRIAGISREEYLATHECHRPILRQLDGSVRFLGRLSHLESLSEIKAADFMIFIRECNRSANAGFPTKFVESVACQTPVITSRCSDLADYVIDGANGFFTDEGLLPELLSDIVCGGLRAQEVLDSDVFDYRRFGGALSAFLAAAQVGGGDG